MTTEKLLKVNEELIKCITHIEDFLEYRFLSNTKEEMRDIIMAHIDNMTDNLRRLNDE